MASIEVKVTLDRPDDVAALIAFLTAVGARPVPPEEKLAAIVASVADGGKNGARLRYLQMVARAGDGGVYTSDLVTAVFDGISQSYGGTHAAIEKTWKSRGGTTWADKLIVITADDRQIMFPQARPLILQLREKQ